MSHVTGNIVTVVPIGIGPDFGTNTFLLSPQAPPPPTTPPGGIKFVILHFENASFPGNNRLEVDLGYGTDVFTGDAGTDFWTRPVNVSAFAGGQVSINYIVDGGIGGGVQLTEYGRGERHEEEAAPHDSYSNSDPFLINGNYTEPQYDPFWFCNSGGNIPPNWENIACLPDGDIRKIVSRSVCMLVGAHGEHVSTCSGTLIGPDQVIMAAHCITSLEDLKSFSVIFDYETNCDGSKPAGYNATFHKVIKSFNHGTLGVSSVLDYIILQIKIPEGGLGIPPIPMRTNYPAAGEQVFGIHHPNGAVKKVSKKHSLGFATVLPYTSSFVDVNFDVSGGSSGSGLFDTNGKFLGVLSNGSGCNLSYSASPMILNDIGAAPLPSPVRDVYIVFDRSGSMTMDGGTDGDTKLEEAKDAADLFVNLINASVGHRVGLVSFSSIATHDINLTTINGPSDRQILKGPPGGIFGISADGSTSIGHGLQIAASHFPAASPGGNKRTILLLTDGLQNRPPMIVDALGSLGNTDIEAIGFGTESSLNGALLTNLAQTHNGLYMRAGDGLDLRKFFSLSFGNIFETGTLLDPEYILAAGKDEATPISFAVCEETSVTIVLGWDKMIAPVTFWIETPLGKKISASEKDNESSHGRKWRFTRLKLPYESEQNGSWKVHVVRTKSKTGEFINAGGDPAVRFFLNVTVKGGPAMHLINRKVRYYTGDTINPLVSIVDLNGFPPPNSKVRVVIKKPTESTGNILSKNRLALAGEIKGDAVPPIYATLLALEQNQNKPIIKYDEEIFDLFDDAGHGDGGMEPDGIFGNPLKDIFKHSGNYTFRAVASFGEGCQGTRELTWSVHVNAGIDGAKTSIRTIFEKNLPNGKRHIRIVFIPKDTYSNLIGPGRVDSFLVAGISGSSIDGGIVDNGNGEYEILIIHDATSGNQPGIVISQEGKSPVIISSKENKNGRWRKWFWTLLFLLIISILIIIILITN